MTFHIVIERETFFGAVFQVSVAPSSRICSTRFPLLGSYCHSQTNICTCARKIREHRSLYMWHCRYMKNFYDTVTHKIVRHRYIETVSHTYVKIFTQQDTVENAYRAGKIFARKTDTRFSDRCSVPVATRSTSHICMFQIYVALQKVNS